MTAVEFHGIVHPRQALLRELVAGVSNPPVGLHEYGRPQVVLGIPPVGGARGHAASAKDAFVHAIELGSVFPALKVLRLTLGLHILTLQPRLNGLVLVVEVCQVGNEILNHVRVGQGLDLDGLLAGLDVEKASEAILSADVHGARAADALPAGPPERQRGVHLVLDLDEGIENHGAASFQVDGVLLEPRLGHRVRIVSVDAELLWRRCGNREAAARRGPCRCHGRATWRHRGPEGRKGGGKHRSEGRGC
mmetsp:Transcript_109657/g.224062  ORF Transcript_109657/g.224062 Transcript_109657/m.224062 type:complete len:249 (+) Transcript_109657:334-1080(+)